MTIVVLGQIFFKNNTKYISFNENYSPEYLPVNLNKVNYIGNQSFIIALKNWELQSSKYQCCNKLINQ